MRPKRKTALVWVGCGLALMLVSLAYGPMVLASGTTSRPAVEIDNTLFASTVPSFATVGHNYTVKVIAVNHLNRTLPVLLRLEVPVDAVYVHPLLVQGSVPPNGQILANFSIIPFNPSYGGALNLTAVVEVWFLSNMSRPQVVDSSSALISGIMPVAAYQWALVLVSVIVLAFVGVVGLTLVRARDNLGNSPAVGSAG